MKKTMLAWLLSLMVFLFSCKRTTGAASSGNTDSTGAPAYQLIWSDEFGGSGVDTSKWSFETGNLHVNNEKEYYQVANASVSNGNLMITARKQDTDGQPYTSARLNTSGHFTVKYGRIEARIKLPAVQGTWPAFWMLGNNIATVGWPQCGEIDIMEQVNQSDTILGTMHWNDNGHVQYGSNTTANPADYHVYAVEWDQNSIRWYVDSTLYVTGNIANNINNTGAFHDPFFIILNLAMGGDLPGQTVDENALPVSMYVDYVRVYQKK